jgi:hypothetical protein
LSGWAQNESGAVVVVPSPAQHKMFRVKRTEKFWYLHELPKRSHRQALLKAGRAGHQGLAPSEIGPENGLVDPGVVEWLVREGLIKHELTKKKREVYRPTEYGWGLVRMHTPHLLRRSYSYENYTSSPSMAMLSEPEAMREAA